MALCRFSIILAFLEAILPYGCLSLSGLCSSCLLRTKSKPSAHEALITKSTELAAALTRATITNLKSDDNPQPPVPTTLLHNEVRTCKSCSKANAKTLLSCTGCLGQLSEEIVKTPNAISAIVLGLKPVTQNFADSRCVVFEDLHRISDLVHCLSVPTKAHIADARWLFQYPIAGLKLIAELKTALAVGVLNRREALARSFPSTFKKVLTAQDNLHTLDANSKIHDLIPRGMFGFNVPGSQNQLHLTYAGCRTRNNVAEALKMGTHLPKERHIPYEYVEKVLTLMADEEQHYFNTGREFFSAATYADKMDAANVQKDFLINNPNWMEKFGYNTVNTVRSSDSDLSTIAPISPLATDQSLRTQENIFVHLRDAESEISKVREDPKSYPLSLSLRKLDMEKVPLSALIALFKDRYGVDYDEMHAQYRDGIIERNEEMEGVMGLLDGVCTSEIDKETVYEDPDAEKYKYAKWWEVYGED